MPSSVDQVTPASHWDSFVQKLASIKQYIIKLVDSLWHKAFPKDTTVEASIELKDIAACQIAIISPEDMAQKLSEKGGKNKLLKEQLTNQCSLSFIQELKAKAEANGKLKEVRTSLRDIFYSEKNPLLQRKLLLYLAHFEYNNHLLWTMQVPKILREIEEEAEALQLVLLLMELGNFPDETVQKWVDAREWEEGCTIAFSVDDKERSWGSQAIYGVGTFLAWTTAGKWTKLVTTLNPAEYLPNLVSFNISSELNIKTLRNIVETIGHLQRPFVGALEQIAGHIIGPAMAQSEWDSYCATTYPAPLMAEDQNSCLDSTIPGDALTGALLIGGVATTTYLLYRNNRSEATKEK